MHGISSRSHEELKRFQTTAFFLQFDIRYITHRRVDHPGFGFGCRNQFVGLIGHNARIQRNSSGGRIRAEVSIDCIRLH
jgi:hypothetical protein